MSGSVSATAVAKPATTARPAPSVGSIVPEAVFEPDVSVGTMLTADGAVWAFDWTGVMRIDPATNQTRRFDLQAEDGSERTSVFGAVGSGSIWVSDFDLDQVRRYDETSGALTATIITPEPEGLLFHRGSLWVTEHRTGSVSRIDPATNMVVATVKVGSAGTSGPERLLAAGGRIWSGIPRDMTVAGIDPSTNKPAGTIAVMAPGDPCGDMASYGDRLYLSGCALAKALAVVDMKTMKAVASPEFDGYVTAPVTVGKGLWLGVSLGIDGNLTAMDPDTLATGRGLPVAGGAPDVLLVADGSMWVSVELESAQRVWILRLPLNTFE